MRQGTCESCLPSSVHRIFDAWKTTLAPWSLKMIPTSLETVIATYFKVLLAFLFCEVCFYVFYKSFGNELSTMSSSLKATPTCCSTCNFRAGDACRWCGGTRVSVLTAVGWEKQKNPSSHFLPLACASHRVIHIHFCLYFICSLKVGAFKNNL